MSKRHRFHHLASRIHKWLALFAGIQILLWFVSGAYMSFMPIERVRGEHLVDRHAAMTLPDNADISGLSSALARYPNAHAVALRTIGGPVFALIEEGHDKSVRIDAATGKLLPPISAVEASQIVRHAWRGAHSGIAGTQWLTKAADDYRGDYPVWRVAMSDAERTRIYIAPDSGQILAVRTDGWRVFDLMWGLHIMDWQGRENSNSPWLFGFALAALLMAMAGLVLLAMRWPLRRKR